IWWIGTSQLAVYIGDRFHFGTSWILLEGIEYYAVIFFDIIPLEHHVFYFRFQNSLDMLFFQDYVPFKDDFISFDGDDLTSIFVYKIFGPCLTNPGCRLPSDCILQNVLFGGHFFSQIKQVKNLFIRIKSNSPQ